MDKFFDAYKSVKPYLIADEAPAGRERLQSAEDRDRFEDTTKCILCAACTTACPVTWTNEEFVGPAAIVNAHRFIFDSRDEGAAERLQILNKGSGVWRCRTIFNCTEACPRGIKITKAIEEVKRALIFDRV
jgi:succinate dehydrogenase / fumarate reductase iron-sulfur subunit